MHGAYNRDRFLPWVEDPQDIIVFLDHHFDLATQGGKNQDEPIQNALRALAYASNSFTIEALKLFDPAEPSFLRGICYVFQDDSRSSFARPRSFSFLLLSADGSAPLTRSWSLAK